jgi:hypothetical protein
MTDRNKFEEMLERLVNEDREGAEALFHEIVVEKSRDIYESLLEDEEVEETTDEEVDEATDEEVDESEEDLDESDDEDLDESDEELDEADEEVDENFFDVAEGDPVDDMMGDIEEPEMGGDMDMEPEMGDDDMGMGDEDGDVEDRVADLEDELEALKAEFEAMMGDEEGDEGEGDMDMDMDMPMDMDSEEGDDDEEAEEEAIAYEAADEEVEEATDEEEVKEGAKSASEIMREYTDKVTATMGDNGANAKSIVAGKNDMGGTSANIAKGDTEAGVEANKGNLKGSALSDQNPKDMNTKNVNVPGAKGATKMASTKGHGAEKKGAGETADKGAGSPLNGAPKRAK